ncbi:salutaridine reductase-like [Rutidosis leptorrhynchoides]|uniref:salutaridine reductase-like n=1 Tax=Rutidosis leptorrhynchoides TaxID=125765 RepID=UPI003A9A588C
MEEKRYAVVTGGNKGIGFEICRQLALNGIEVILTARNETRGLEAVQKLKVDGILNVIFHQLDIQDPTSIATLATYIETNFKRLDILVNNAAEIGLVYVDDTKFKYGGGFVQFADEKEKAEVFHDIIEQPYELGEKCLKINYYGTKNLTEALLPLLHISKSPKIVNVSSEYGNLNLFHGEKLKEELNDIEKLTEERIDEIIKWFLRDLKANNLRDNGWPLTTSAYKFSKAALNAYTRLMARKFPHILVNCVTPGYCVTDMTSGTGFHTAEEGAKGPVMAALLPDDGPSGVFFMNMEIAPFMGEILIS